MKSELLSLRKFYLLAVLKKKSLIQWMDGLLYEWYQCDAHQSIVSSLHTRLTESISGQDEQWCHQSPDTTPHRTFVFHHLPRPAVNFPSGGFPTLPVSVGSVFPAASWNSRSMQMTQAVLKRPGSVWETLLLVSALCVCVTNTRRFLCLSSNQSSAAAGNGWCRTVSHCVWLCHSLEVCDCDQNRLFQWGPAGGVRADTSLDLLFVSCYNSRPLSVESLSCCVLFVCFCACLELWIPPCF